MPSTITLSCPASFTTSLPVKVANNNRHSDDVLRNGYLKPEQGQRLVSIGNRDFTGPDWALQIVEKHWSQVSQKWEAGEPVAIKVQLPQ